MDRLLLISTALRSVAYDERERVLEVKFVHGSVYRYLDVPGSVYEGLLAAESRGVYFDEHVKRAGYKYERVRGGDSRKR
jgi:hypothetical protein